MHHPKCSSRVVRVKNSLKNVVLGKLKDVHVTIGEVMIDMDFVVLDRVPFDMSIGRLKIVRLGEIIEFKRRELRF